MSASLPSGCLPLSISVLPLRHVLLPYHELFFRCLGKGLILARMSARKRELDEWRRILVLRGNIRIHHLHDTQNLYGSLVGELEETR
jgi:hypothetical protein